VPPPAEKTLYQPLLERLAAWFLRPRRRRELWLRQRLADRLEMALPRTIRQGPAAVALVEAAMALSQADGSFGDEEFELYRSCLDRLELSTGQLGGMSLIEDPDPVQIRELLQALPDRPTQDAVGRCLLLFVAADGGADSAERRLLLGFLQALHQPALLRELPGLCRQFHYPLNPLDQLRVGIGEFLTQQLLHTRRRGRRRG
jgi:tellurite resistance protein